MVQDLNAAVIAAEKLVEYRQSDTSRSKPKPATKANGGEKKKNNGKEAPSKDKQPTRHHTEQRMVSCYVSGGNYYARDCKNKGKRVNAVQSEEAEDEGPSIGAHMGALRLLNALKSKPIVAKIPSRELMYVDVKINDKATRTMVDTGATHNFTRTRRSDIWVRR